MLYFKDLYELLFKSLASGDRTVIHNICCTGIEAQLMKQINSRSENLVQTWEVESYVSKPKLISDTAAPAPQDGTGVRQKVILFHTIQSLTRKKLTMYGEKEEKAKRKREEKKEYFMFQEVTLNGQRNDWRVWGQVYETDLEDYFYEKNHPLEVFEQARARSSQDRMR